MDRFQAIKIFKTVVEAQSYSGAARQLGLSRSHLSKQIKQLEESLGVRLLNRTTRNVQGTELGLLFYDSCARITNELEEAESKLRALQREPRGTLKILAPKSFAVLELADALQDFNARYPDLEVAVYLVDDMLDLIKHRFDLALRFGNQPDSSLIAKRLCSIGFVVCAAPKYLRRNGVPTHPADLGRHDCLRNLTLASDFGWKFTGPTGEVEVEVRGRLSANSTVLLRECVLKGYGIGMLPVYSVKREIRAGLLRPLLTKYRLPELPLFAVYPFNRHLATKVRVFVDFLSARFGNGRLLRADSSRVKSRRGRSRRR